MDENNQTHDHKNKVAKVQLPKDLEDIIQDLPEEKKEKVLRIITAQTIETASAFSGPLPPPSVLGGYNEILANGAERIMKMAENQSSHRIDMEKLAIKEELRQSKNGQFFGFILAILGMLIAFGLAYLGHDTVAGIFGTTTIVGLVTIFVIGKRKQSKDFDD